MTIKSQPPSLISFLIAAVIFLSGIIVLVLPKFVSPRPPAPHPSWQTFTSNITGYQISYPPDFYISNKPLSIEEPLILTKNLAGNKSFTISLGVNAQGTACANALCNQKQAIQVSFGEKQIATEQIWPYTYGEFTLEFDQNYPTSDNIIKVTAVYPKEQDLEQVNLIFSTFRFINPSDSPVVTPTCRPRPACLDAKPRCLMPESADMCPPASPN